MSGIQYYFKVLQNYATFSGRARRSEYWYFCLFSSLLSITLAIIGYLIGLEFLDSIYSLAVLLPSLAVGVRRMHDVGKSGWFILIPIYNIILACTDGDHGSNEYGADPKNLYKEEGFDFDNNQFSS